MTYWASNVKDCLFKNVLPIRGKMIQERPGGARVLQQIDPPLFSFAKSQGRREREIAKIAKAKSFLYHFPSRSRLRTFPH